MKMDSKEVISQMSDEELTKELLKYGMEVGIIDRESRTLYEDNLKLLMNAEAQNDSEISNETKAVSALQSQFKKSDVYYGIFIPESAENKNPDIKKIYTDRNECLAVLKRINGARFKGFPTREEALQFAEYGPVIAIASPLHECQDRPTAPIIGEKGSAFRGPKSQEMVKFRKSIEKGNSEYFEECVSSNPRFLVSSGDTPSILQEGSRYNALHIACRNDKPEFCRKVLSVISSEEFFKRLYPDDPVEISKRRSDFLVDLYLNTPDKGLNETPLHFACKHGSYESVKYLLSYPSCDRKSLNKFHQTPFEIICSRVKLVSSELASKIKDLFEDQFYVPVLRDEDNCHPPCIAPPWSPVTSNDSPPDSNRHSPSQFQDSPITPLFKVKGYAGPMNTEKAESFYNRWRKSTVPSPARNSKGKVAALRIADHEKGLERVGRKLATEFEVGWVEYWNFLGDFANLESLEGLQKLENHLKYKYKEAIEVKNCEDSMKTINELSETNFSPKEAEENSIKNKSVAGVFDSSCSTLSSIGGLCQDLEALRLNTSLSPNPEVDNFYKDRGTSALKRKLSNSKSHSCSKRPIFEKNEENTLLNNNSNSSNGNQNDSFETNYPNNQEYNFAVQSTQISAQRLSSILGDISRTISSHVGPDFLIARKLRNKMKPEIESLRSVLGKCFSFSQIKNLDFSFVHIFLAAKTVENLMENLSASNLFLVSETLKLLVMNMDSFEESSSEEEEGLADVEIDETEKNDVISHFKCVTRELDKSSVIGLKMMKEGKEEDKINLRELGDCICNWKSLKREMQNFSSRKYPVDIQEINSSLNRSKAKSTPGSTSRFSRAHSFLHRFLFGKTEETDIDQSSDSKVHPVFENVVKQLTFEDEKDDDKKSILESNDSESFASAVSSFEDDSSMGTPDQQILFFINGLNPSKDDLDVYISIEGLSIDENIYPMVSQWLQLIESFPRDIRESWRSSCCGHRQLHHSSPISSSPPYSGIKPR